ncbi:MAG: serine/threonine protein kinase [Lachnospiraceae bacterium]|nr:serine/threonine protein kinase [Lachnospiraceae bacterium]
MLEQYELEGQIGEGGFSRVYVGRHLLLQRKAAIKVIPCKYLDVARKEAQFYARRVSDALPLLYDVFLQEGNVFLVQEYVEGKSLKLLIREGMSLSFVREVSLQIAVFLKQLHGHVPPIAYLDLKPENLILEPGGRLRVLDMGTAVFIGGEQSGCFAGTNGYAPAAQKLGKRPEVSWDLYAFAVLLREMLTGDRRESIPADDPANAVANGSANALAEGSVYAPEVIPREYQNLMKQCKSGVLTDGASLLSALQAMEKDPAYSIIKSFRCCEFPRNLL